MKIKDDYIETQICDRLYKLKNYISSRVSSRVVADDIYGDTMLRIWRIVRNRKFKEGLSVDAFMWLCAKSVISDYFKKESSKKRNCVDEYGHYCDTATESLERVYEASVENEIFMEKARKELNNICRRVLMLLLFQNMKHWEIADTLGIPRVTVSSYLMRMRKQFGDIHLNKVRTRMEMRG